MKKTVDIALSLALLLVLPGCKGEKLVLKPATALSTPSSASTSTPAPVAPATPGPAQESEPLPTQAPPPEDRLFPRNFCQMSGVGGWSTELQIAADGSFSGFYHDSNMGDWGEGYSNGTLYYSDFTGLFSEPEWVNEYTYRIWRKKLLETDMEEKIIDEVLYIPVSAQDLVGEELLLYLPGAPIGELPEEFVWWLTAPAVLSEDYETPPCYGLYDVQYQAGYFEY